MNPKMLKQIEQMQSNMMKAQEELGSETVEGSAGGGAVVVVMNGHQQVQGITIDPEFVDPEDVETLQDAVVAALNDAQNKDGVAVLIAAPAAEVKSVRINVTMPADVLDQIDRYAEREGFTRSGFLAQAAKKVMSG